MDKSEILFSHSLLEKEFFKRLEDPRIKVISFDIFDTLFFRKCGVPTNVFEKMGEHQEIKEKFDTPSAFNLYRQNAEKAARRAVEKEEITLEEIYEQLALSKQERQRFQAIELETEKKMLRLNWQLQRWITFALKADKKVILLSDMYLHVTQIKEVALYQLEDQEKITKIYVSNECNATKATGTLFLHTLEDLDIDPQELLHIGDNPRSDIAIAKSFGIQTLYYGYSPEQKERLMYEAAYMQEDLRSGVDIRSLASLLCPYEGELQKFYFDIGASIFAPLLWEFSHWLCDKSQIFQREGLHFIMREGALFQKCFEKLYPKKETHLLYASRKSTHFLTLNADDIGSANIHMYKSLSIEDLYKSFFLNIEDTHLKEYGKTTCEEADTLFVEESTLLDLVLKDLQKKHEQITDAFKEQKELLSKYLHSLKITDKSCLIDFGGGGTIIKRLLEFLPQELRPTTNILFYQHAQGYNKLSNKHVLSFLPLTKKTAKAIESIHRTPEFFEILFNGVNETTVSYKKEGIEVFPSTSLLRSNHNNLAKIIDSFWQGIEVFFELCKLYKLPPQSYDRESLTLLLSRVIELPTPNEVAFLGELEYDEGKASEHFYKLIDAKKKEQIRDDGIEKIYADFLCNPTKYRQTTPWMEGLVTSVAPKYLLSFYKASVNPNEEVINKILLELDASKQKEVMVYGAGELFIQLLPFLKERSVTIEALIDSRAQTKSFWVEGYRVVSLEEALHQKQKASVVIASGVYARKIEALICDFAHKNQKQISFIMQKEKEE